MACRESLLISGFEFPLKLLYSGLFTAVFLSNSEYTLYIGKNLYVTPDRYTGEVGDFDPVDTPHLLSTYYHPDLKNHFNFQEDDKNVVTVDQQISLSKGSKITIDYESTETAQERNGVKQLREKQLLPVLIQTFYKATDYLTQAETDVFELLPSFNNNKINPKKLMTAYTMLSKPR